jgi:hypothetical protein
MDIPKFVGCGVLLGLYLESNLVDLFWFYAVSGPFG